VIESGITLRKRVDWKVGWSTHGQWLTLAVAIFAHDKSVHLNRHDKKQKSGFGLPPSAKKQKTQQQTPVSYGIRGQDQLNKRELTNFALFILY